MIHVPSAKIYDKNSKLMTKIGEEKIMANIGVILTTNIGHFGHKINNKYRGSKTGRKDFFHLFPDFSRRMGSKRDN